MYDFDAAEADTKAAEGSLMPNLSLQGTASHSVDTDTTLGTTRTDQASITAQAIVPLYDGGVAASQIRQAKETLAQNRLVLDQARRQTEAAVTTAWGMNEGAKTAIRAGAAEVRRSASPPDGPRQDAPARQRTT